MAVPLSPKYLAGKRAYTNFRDTIHVSLLIEMGFSALAIAERMGHEAVDITYRYAHLFPTKQDEMAAALDGARG